MLIYLAGPIDAADDAKGWREDASESLISLGFSTFSPAHAFRTPHEKYDVQKPLEIEVCSSIQAINKQALHRCHCVLANLAGPSYGTPLECEEAARRLLPVVVFNYNPRSIYSWGWSWKAEDLAGAIHAIKDRVWETPDDPELLQALHEATRAR